MLYERIPEQTASINDGSGTLWTSKNTYNDSGTIATRTDASGVITSYTYDDLNRLTNISYTLPNPNPDNVQATDAVTYNYDNNQNSQTKGNLLSVTVGSSYSETYTYTVAGGANNGTDISETLITYTIGSRSYTANFQHNQAGLHTRFGHLYYEYDSRGRLSAVKNSLGAAWISNITYNVSGQVTGDTLGNGLGAITESFGYDANRLQNTTHTATRGLNSFMNLTYSYTASAGQQGFGSTAGNNGLLMNVSGTINGQTESAAYTYDLLGRLITSNQTTYDKATVTAQRRFAYDRWGNRTGVWDTISRGNLIQSIVLQQPNSVPIASR